jgi:predicted nucleotidyltransferase component of viral defense system
MMYDRQIIGAQAKRLGFVRDTFEKMYRLADILRDVAADAALSGVLALKGGTAINLTIFKLPRLSVDLDFDFIGDAAREELETAKSGLLARIDGYMKTHGYSQKTSGAKIAHSLNSFVYSYTNAGGNSDNIKIEINYSLRSHILPTELRAVETLGIWEPMEVRCVAPVEIFASKTVALLTRTAMRDLYDISNLLKFGLFDRTQYDALRKCAVFYAAIAGEQDIDRDSLRKIDAITYHQVRTDLKPVLRKDDGFNLETAKKDVKEFFAELLILPPNEREFLQAFRNAEYKPELLFKGETLERVRSHPMALWRTSADRTASPSPTRNNEPTLLEQISEAKLESKASHKTLPPIAANKDGREI